MGPLSLSRQSLDSNPELLSGFLYKSGQFCPVLQPGIGHDQLSC